MSDLSDVEFMGCDAISNKVRGDGQHFVEFLRQGSD